MKLHHLYIQRIMIEYVKNVNNIITRKKCLYVINNHFRFGSKMNEELKKSLRKEVAISILDNMVKFKLLEKVNRYDMKIINPEKSARIDKSVLARIITEGNK